MNYCRVFETLLTVPISTFHAVFFGQYSSLPKTAATVGSAPYLCMPYRHLVILALKTAESHAYRQYLKRVCNQCEKITPDVEQGSGNYNKREDKHIRGICGTVTPTNVSLGGFSKNNQSCKESVS